MPIETKVQKRRSWLAFGLLVFACFSIGTAIAYGLTKQDESRQNGKNPKALTEIKNSEVKNRPIEKMSRGYVTSDNCRQCHAHHYDTWHASHHRTMTQVPSQDSVIADFDNKVLHRSGQEFRFFHEDDDYFLEIKGDSPDSEDKSLTNGIFKIVLMTGAHHQLSLIHI